MYYYKARMYSPTLGRFMQTDPIGYKDQFNLYEYVGGDPVGRTDPSGLCTGSLISDRDGGCKGGGFVNGAGSCSGNCVSSRDEANAIAKFAFQQSSQPAPGTDSCASQPLCGGKIPANLAKEVSPVLHDKAFQKQFIEMWVKSNPKSSDPNDKNEHAFWAGNGKNGVELGILFKGWKNIISGSDALFYRDGLNIFVHPHPFTINEGGRPEFSGKDISSMRQLHIIGILMSHSGIFIYDGR